MEVRDDEWMRRGDKSGKRVAWVDFGNGKDRIGVTVTSLDTEGLKTAKIKPSVNDCSA